MANEFRRKVTLRLLEDADLQRMHDLSMELLEKNGVLFPYEPALELLRSHGFRVDGQQVYFTEKQIRTALETAPSHFVLHGRNPKRSLDLGGGDYGVAGPLGPVNFSAFGAPTRGGTLQDVENLIKIYQSSSVVNMNTNNGVEANDISLDRRHLMIMRALLCNTDKPFYSKVLDGQQINQMLDMTEIAVGKKLEKGGQAYFAVASTPSTSPLAWSGEVLGAIMALAERGQVVTTGTATSCGITGPISPFGTLALQNAEVLTGIVLAQLVNPGNPVGYGSAATPGNMKSANSAFGSPGVVALQLASLEMGQRFYHLPSRTEVCSTNSTGMDLQCGIETYESTLANTLGGADYMLSELGTLDGLFTTSLEKTILDEEILSRLIHMHKGIDVSEAAGSVEEILRVGTRGTYILSPNTMAHMFDDWYPKITNWNNNVENRPEDDFTYVLRRAKEAWEQRLAQAPACMLDHAVVDELDDYIASALA